MIKETQNKIIFVVEDNHGLRNEMVNYLVNHFTESMIVPFEDPGDALRYAFQEKPDILITDIRLNDQSGLDLAKELKKHFQEGIHIIVYTNYDGLEYQDYAKKCGADHFLSKSDTSPWEMIQVLEKILVENR